MLSQNGCSYLLLGKEKKEKGKERKRDKARKDSPCGEYHPHLRNSILEKYSKVARNLKEKKKTKKRKIGEETEGTGDD